jgi:hypothetical protein
MTIAVALKVQDGVVLAADSATTLTGEIAPGVSGAINVYNNADKIVNLRKGLPIGIVFWGAGGMGAQGISTLAKDLRHRLSEGDNDWRLDRSSYTLEDVAERARRFLIHEHYDPEFASLSPKPELGFLVAGYSAGASLSECWPPWSSRCSTPPGRRSRRRLATR